MRINGWAWLPASDQPKAFDVRPLAEAELKSTLPGRVGAQAGHPLVKRADRMLHERLLWRVPPSHERAITSSHERAMTICDSGSIAAAWPFPQNASLPTP